MLHSNYERLYNRKFLCLQQASPNWRNIYPSTHVLGCGLSTGVLDEPTNGRHLFRRPYELRRPHYGKSSNISSTIALFFTSSFQWSLATGTPCFHLESFFQHHCHYFVILCRLHDDATDCLHNGNRPISNASTFAPNPFWVFNQASVKYISQACYFLAYAPLLLAYTVFSLSLNRFFIILTTLSSPPPLRGALCA